jgi:hypothetical protein
MAKATFFSSSLNLAGSLPAVFDDQDIGAATLTARGYRMKSS